MEKSMKGKPDLAILIGHALAKKGKAKHDPLGADDEEAEAKDDMASGKDEHVQQIADEMLDAIEAKDSGALKDLLLELLECGSSEEY